MAESDSPMPSTLWAIPAPLIMVAAVALLTVFGLPRTAHEPERAKAVASPPGGGTARASDAEAPSRSPAVELLRRYLNEVDSGDSATPQPLVTSAPPAPFSAELVLPDGSRAGLSLRRSGPAASQISGVQAAKIAEERRLWELRTQLQELKQAHPFQMRCLVATVPDPIDSHFQLMFDAALAAMTRACEQHGYALDRHELPWARELRERPLSGRPDVRKYRFPGAVLFRSARTPIDAQHGETCDLLMLLLVGETPTGGVRKNSLCAALNFVGAWDGVQKQTSDRLSIRLLGPTFSGSSPSLRWAIFDWRNTFAEWLTAARKADARIIRYRQISVAIVSGSATASSNRNLLTLDAGSTEPAKPPEPGLDITFQTTVIPDGVTARHLLEHLVSVRRIPEEQIALLVESNTGYGQAQESYFEKVLVLPFPMALSRIRSEYEQSQLERVESAGDLPPATRRNLKLPLNPPPYATDVLPTFADGAAAVTDLSLEQILATISRRDIRAVGIIGTDIRDKLFLAQQVRRYAPNVQLFMLESDLLYTHADYAPSLSGTLLASTYPLFTQNQRWTGHSQKELLFPADTAEGIYNAAVLLLNRMVKSEPGHGKPQRLLDYSYPFETPAPGPPRPVIPPLWLTIAGENGLWPVQARRLDAKDDSRVLAPDAWPTTAVPARPMPDPPSCLPALAASLVSLAFLLVFWAANGRPASPVEHGDGPAMVLSQGLGRIRASCRWLALPGAAGIRHLLTVLCLFAALLVLQTLACSPALVFVHVASDPNLAGDCWWVVLFSLAVGGGLLWVLFALMFRTLFALLSLVLHTLVNSCRLVARGRPPLARFLAHRRLVGGVVQVLIATGVGVVISRWLPTFDENPARDLTSAAIFVARVGTLSSGVTWLVPAVLLAAIIGCWAACQLWRRHFLEIYPLANPVSPQSAPGAKPDHSGSPADMHRAGFAERFGELNSRLDSAWFLPTEIVDWLFLVLLGFGTFYVFWVRWIGTAEGWIFDGIFRWAAGIAILLIGWSLLHIKSLGGLFERLLRRTAQHALVSAFDLVPDRLAAKTAGQIFAASPHPGDLEQPVRCLRRLADEVPNPWEDAAADAGRAQEQFAELLCCPRSQKGDVDRRAAELNRFLADIAAWRIVPRLIPYWNRKATFRVAGEDTTDGAVSTSSWEVRAEVFLAMQFVNLIRQVFAHLKTQLTFLVVMLLCLLAAFHSYPFQPVRLIMQLSYGLTCWCLITTLVLIIRFNRCEVLSRLSKTTPNRFTFDRALVLPLLTFVVIPLLSLLAVQFPGIGRMLFGWLETCRGSLSG